jgi:hypothetical protein
MTSAGLPTRRWTSREAARKASGRLSVVGVWYGRRAVSGTVQCDARNRYPLIPRSMIQMAPSPQPVISDERPIANTNHMVRRIIRMPIASGASCRQTRRAHVEMRET